MMHNPYVNKERYTISMDPEIHQKAVEIAEAERRSLSSLIEVAVLEYIKQQEKDERTRS